MVIDRVSSGLYCRREGAAFERHGQVNMSQLKSRMAIGAVVANLSLAVAACDDSGGTTTPVELTTTTGG
jgi:hypothetical protein